MQLIKDGEEVYVEYGQGPCAYSAAWEGRPPTPDFEWNDGVVLPAHDIWLEQLDLKREGLAALVDKSVQEVDAGLAHDLGRRQSANQAARRQPAGPASSSTSIRCAALRRVPAERLEHMCVRASAPDLQLGCALVLAKFAYLLTSQHCAA